MALEIEVKFSAAPTQLAALLEAYPTGQRFVMATTYYDTPSGALSARRYTLRSRKENELTVCTLKTPACGDARNEFELECENLQDALPQLCAMSGLAELPGLLEEGIVPICGASFIREARRITLEDGVVELALDQGSLLGGFGKTLPLCEVEVELKEGDPSAACAFAEKLAADYGLQPEKRSKFQRARMLARGEL